MTQNSADNAQELKAQNTKYLIRIILLSTSNILLFSSIPFDNRTVYERFSVALPAFFITQPIIGFVLGALVSLIPYRQLTYSKKYLRSSLLAIYILSIIEFALMIIGLIPILLNS